MLCGGSYSNGSRPTGCRDKPVCAAQVWQDIAASVEKVCNIDARMPKSHTPREHQNKEVDRALKTRVSGGSGQGDGKGELFVAQWAHEVSGHRGRDATSRSMCL